MFDEPDFEITQDGEDWIGVRDDLRVVVRGGGGKLYHRRKMQPFLQRYKSALVAELDGVKVYVRKGVVVITRDKMKL